MIDNFDGLGWREYMRGIENGNIDPTSERLRAVCRLAREAIEGSGIPLPGRLDCDMIGAKAREWAGHYPQSSDGRNTFILFAEWVESLPPTLNSGAVTKAEIQSGSDRQQWAEGLILQLPENHDGRNSWLLNYGRGAVAKSKREKRGLSFNEQSQAINPPALPRAVEGGAATQNFIQNLIRHIETSQIQTHIYHNGDRQSRGIHMSIGENEVQEILAHLRALSPNTGDGGSSDTRSKC